MYRNNRNKRNTKNGCNDNNNNNRNPDLRQMFHRQNKPKQTNKQTNKQTLKLGNDPVNDED